MVFLLMVPCYWVFLLWFSRTGFPGRPANKSRLIPAIWNVTQVTVCRRKKQERRLKPPPPLTRMQIKLDQSQPPWLYTVLYNDGISNKQTQKSFSTTSRPPPRQRAHKARQGAASLPQISQNSNSTHFESQIIMKSCVDHKQSQENAHQAHCGQTSNRRQVNKHAPCLPWSWSTHLT